MALRITNHEVGVRFRMPTATRETKTTTPSMPQTRSTSKQVQNARNARMAARPGFVSDEVQELDAQELAMSEQRRSSG